VLFHFQTRVFNLIYLMKDIIVNKYKKCKKLNTSRKQLVKIASKERKRYKLKSLLRKKRELKSEIKIMLN
jgi:hypothetical protein